MRCAMPVAFFLLSFALCAEEPTPAKADNDAETKIDLAKEGAYTSGQWVYTVKITAAGTKSAGVVGSLTFANEPVHPDAGVNDWVSTPWGKLYYMGQVNVPWGRHGWMPEPKKNRPEGRQLDAPK